MEAPIEPILTQLLQEMNTQISDLKKELEVIPGKTDEVEKLLKIFSSALYEQTVDTLLLTLRPNEMLTCSLRTYILLDTMRPYIEKSLLALEAQKE